MSIWRQQVSGQFVTPHFLPLVGICRILETQVAYVICERSLIVLLWNPGPISRGIILPYLPGTVNIIPENVNIPDKQVFSSA